MSFLTNWLPGPFAGRTRAPRPGPGGMDLDGADDRPRPRDGLAVYGQPSMCGGVSALLPLFGGVPILKQPFGPSVNTPLTNPGQVIFPGNIKT
jgi:hypothetical protein